MSEAEAAAAEAAAAAAAEQALLTPEPAPAPRPSRPSRSGSGGEHVKKKNMTSGQLRREARARGIEVPEDASREEIQRLLDGELAAVASPAKVAEEAAAETRAARRSAAEAALKAQLGQ